MKVLILANNDAGLYNFRKELIQRLVQENIQVHIALPYGERVSDLERIGCVYHDIRIDRRGMNPVRDSLLLRNYLKLLRDLKPNVVLTYTIKPNIYGGIASRLCKKKYLANITGLGTAIENGGWKKTLLLHLYRIALKKASCVFFQNRSNYKDFKFYGICQTNEKILPGSGVNLKYHIFEEYPSPDSPIVILFIGRIMRDKGVNEFFEMAEQVKKEYPEVIFQMIGFYEENYKEKVSELQRRKIIDYLGFQEDVRPFLKKCWAVIQPSYHEGLSNVLLEAGAHGRPLLASRVPGCQETFDEEISGLGFEVKSSLSMIKTVKHFIELPYQKKREMGEAARKKVEKEYNREIVIQEYLHEIKSCTEKRIN